MAWTSPSTVNATQGLSDFLPYISEVTQFWFGRMLMIAIYVIFLFGYLRANNRDWIGGMAVSGYVTFVIGLFFWIIGFVSGLDFAIIIGVMAVGTILLLTQKKDF